MLRLVQEPCMVEEEYGADKLQATNKAMSFYSSRARLSIYLREQSSTPSQLLRQLQIVKYMPLGLLHVATFR